MKILVIQTAFPGDAILTLPLIQEISKQYENSEIDILCIPSTKILFDASPYIKNVIVYDKRKIDKGFFAFFRLAKKLKQNKYNKIISPHRSARSSLLAFFSGAKESVSFDKSSLAFLYNKKIKYHTDWHEVRRNLSLLGEDYSESWKILPEILITKEIKKHVEGLFSHVDFNKLIVIAPGSVWETKKYPIEYFQKICDELVKNSYEIIVIGGKEDSRLAEILVKNNPKIINSCGQLNFLHSIYLIKLSRLLICNDSAPTHLGMATDSSVLTIYCSTIPKFGFYPYNAKSKHISFDKLDCKPCGIHGHIKCPKEHFKCGFELKPSQVLEEIYLMLKAGH